MKKSLSSVQKRSIMAHIDFLGEKYVFKIEKNLYRPALEVW
ncbi:hypothetical protein STRDD11_00120 [Streptococcus sp. DD11]|nr:hypothetical protein STRDD11_00120 [Streptococcus sp. DD11]